MRRLGSLRSIVGPLSPYVLVVGVEATVLVSLAASFRLAGQQWGADGFAAYALLRRVLSFAVPVATAGMEVGLPRYLAMEDVATRRATLFLAALSITAVAAGGIALLLCAAPAAAAGWLFGSAARVHWVPTLALLIFAYAIHVAVFSYWRGQLRIGRSSLLAVIVYGLLPVPCILLVESGPLQSLNALALAVLIVSLAFLPRVWRRGAALRPVLEAMRQLVVYGLPRTLAALGLMALFALPAVLAARYSGLGMAGVLAFGVTVIGALGSATSPVGTVLLPRAARHVRDLRFDLLRDEYRLWSLLVSGAGIVGVVLIAVAARPLIGFFVPGDSASYVAAFVVLALGAPCYMFFCVARHVVDALSERGENARSAGFAIVAFALWWAIARAWLDLGPGVAEASALTAGLATLAARTAWRSWRLLRDGAAIEGLPT